VVEAILAPPDDSTFLAASLGAEPGRESLSQRAYAQIRRSLTSSRLHPGQRLILRPLAAELGLSPTPVREALLRLVSEQALCLDERGSAIVPIMTKVDFSELAEMRGDLEARAAERAVEFATDAQIDELEQVNAICVAAHVRNQHMAMLDANATFHRCICKAGRSPLILRTLEGLWMRLGPLYALSFDRPLRPLTSDGHPHDRLIDALRRRDVRAARAAALVDINDSNALLDRQLADF
jgi:DNA-binding GntR family transcriptional regulator